jgi:hypothetical protein
MQYSWWSFFQWPYWACFEFLPLSQGWLWLVLVPALLLFTAEGFIPAFLPVVAGHQKGK